MSDHIKIPIGTPFTIYVWGPDPYEPGTYWKRPVGQHWATYEKVENPKPEEGFEFMGPLEQPKE